MTQIDGEASLPVFTAFQGLSPELDNLFELDRESKLRRDAAARISEVALTLIPGDRAVRTPILERQWTDWSEGFIEPIRQAGNLDVSFRLMASISGPEGSVSRVYNNLELVPTQTDDLEVAISDVKCSNSLEARGGEQAFVSSGSMMDRARRIGYKPFDAQNGRSTFLRRPIMQPAVNTKEFSRAAREKRQRVIDGLTFMRINFSVEGRTRSSRYVDGELMSGIVTDPNTKAGVIEITDFSTYYDYANDRGDVRRGSRELAQALDMGVVKAIAKGMKTQTEIEDMVVDDAEEIRTSFDNRIKVAERVLELVTTSAEFRLLIE